MESIEVGSLDLGQHCTDHDNRNTGEVNQMEAPHSIAFSSHADGVDLMQIVSVFLLSVLHLSHKICDFYLDTLDHFPMMSEDLNVCYHLVFHLLS